MKEGNTIGLLMYPGGYASVYITQGKGLSPDKGYVHVILGNPEFDGTSTQNEVGKISSELREFSRKFFESYDHPPVNLSR